MHDESKQSGAKDTNSSDNSFGKRFGQSILKLTFIYAIILASILFVSSSVLYSAFSARLEHRFKRPVIQEDISQPGVLQIDLNPTVGYPTPDDVRADLVNLLLVVNGFLLLIAGALSYKLAEWTLSPLKDTYERERRFLSDASHELRTPLSILKTDLENQLSDKRVSATVTKKAESNLEEVNRMTQIVTDLLTLSRLNEYDRKLKEKPVDLAAIVEKTGERLGGLAKANGIGIIAIVPTEKISIMSDEEVIEAVLMNCAKNAITYNKPGGTVTLSLAKNKSGVKIIISDTGIGINKKDLSKVFDRFFRVDKSRSRQTGGSGLGLSIVKTSMERLGGTVEAESTPDKGTTITLSFPA
jgi:signal transduction histidine kinase